MDIPNEETEALEVLILPIFLFYVIRFNQTF